MKKRIGMTLLAIVSALSFVCCTDKKSVEASDIADVWTATGTERILGDKDYSTRYGQKTLYNLAFQNEYECAQIIVSAKKDVAYYDIEISDLQDANFILYLQRKTRSLKSWTLFSAKAPEIAGFF